MLELHTRQVDTVDATAIKRARKNEKEQLRGDKAKVPLGTASNEITGGLQLVCGRPTLALSSALVPQTLSCLVCIPVFISLHTFFSPS